MAAEVQAEAHRSDTLLLDGSACRAPSHTSYACQCCPSSQHAPSPLYCIAGHGGIANIIDDMQLLSTEAEGVSEAVPEERRRALVNRAGRVGALLGLTDTRIGAADCKLEWRPGSFMLAAPSQRAFRRFRHPAVVLNQGCPPPLPRPQLCRSG